MPGNIPGTGLIIALVALTLLGFLTANLVGRTLVEAGETHPRPHAAGALDLQGPQAGVRDAVLAVRLQLPQSRPRRVSVARHVVAGVHVAAAERRRSRRCCRTRRSTSRCSCRARRTRPPASSSTWRAVPWSSSTSPSRPRRSSSCPPASSSRRAGDGPKRLAALAEAAKAAQAARPVAEAGLGRGAGEVRLRCDLSFRGARKREPGIQASEQLSWPSTSSLSLPA